MHPQTFKKSNYQPKSHVGDGAHIRGLGDKRSRELAFPIELFAQSSPSVAGGNSPRVAERKVDKRDPLAIGPAHCSFATTTGGLPHSPLPVADVTWSRAIPDRLLLPRLVEGALTDLPSNPLSGPFEIIDNSPHGSLSLKRPAEEPSVVVSSAEPRAIGSAKSLPLHSRPQTGATQKTAHSASLTARSAPNETPRQMPTASQKLRFPSAKRLQGGIDLRGSMKPSLGMHHHDDDECKGTSNVVSTRWVASVRQGNDNDDESESSRRPSVHGPAKQTAAQVDLSGMDPKALLRLAQPSNRSTEFLSKSSLKWERRLLHSSPRTLNVQRCAGASAPVGLALSETYDSSKPRLNDDGNFASAMILPSELGLAVSHAESNVKCVPPVYDSGHVAEYWLAKAKNVNEFLSKTVNLDSVHHLIKDQLASSVINVSSLLSGDDGHIPTPEERFRTTLRTAVDDIIFQLSRKHLLAADAQAKQDAEEEEAAEGEGAEFDSDSNASNGSQGAGEGEDANNNSAVDAVAATKKTKKKRTTRKSREMMTLEARRNLMMMDIDTTDSFGGRYQSNLQLILDMSEATDQFLALTQDDELADGANDRDIAAGLQAARNSVFEGDPFAHVTLEPRGERTQKGKHTLPSFSYADVQHPDRSISAFAQDGLALPDSVARFVHDDVAENGLAVFTPQGEEIRIKVSLVTDEDRDRLNEMNCLSDVQQQTLAQLKALREKGLYQEYFAKKPARRPREEIEKGSGQGAGDSTFSAPDTDSGIITSVVHAPATDGLEEMIARNQQAAATNATQNKKKKVLDLNNLGKLASERAEAAGGRSGGAPEPEALPPIPGTLIEEGKLDNDLFFFFYGTEPFAKSSSRGNSASAAPSNHTPQRPGTTSVSGSPSGSVPQANASPPAVSHLQFQTIHCWFRNMSADDTISVYISVDPKKQLNVSIQPIRCLRTASNPNNFTLRVPPWSVVEAISWIYVPPLAEEGATVQPMFRYHANPAIIKRSKRGEVDEEDKLASVKTAGTTGQQPAGSSAEARRRPTMTAAPPEHVADDKLAAIEEAKRQERAEMLRVAMAKRAKDANGPLEDSAKVSDSEDPLLTDKRKKSRQMSRGSVLTFASDSSSSRAASTVDANIISNAPLSPELKPKPKKAGKGRKGSNVQHVVVPSGPATPLPNPSQPPLPVADTETQPAPKHHKGKRKKKGGSVPPTPSDSAWNVPSIVLDQHGSTHASDSDAGDTTKQSSARISPVPEHQDVDDNDDDLPLISRAAPRPVRVEEDEIDEDALYNALFKKEEQNITVRRPSNFRDENRSQSSASTSTTQKAATSNGVSDATLLQAVNNMRSSSPSSKFPLNAELTTARRMASLRPAKGEDAAARALRERENRKSNAGSSQGGEESPNHPSFETADDPDEANESDLMLVNRPKTISVLSGKLSADEKVTQWKGKRNSKASKQLSPAEAASAADEKNAIVETVLAAAAAQAMKGDDVKPPLSPKAHHRFRAPSPEPLLKRKPNEVLEPKEKVGSQETTEVDIAPSKKGSGDGTRAPKVIKREGSLRKQIQEIAVESGADPNLVDTITVDTNVTRRKSTKATPDDDAQSPLQRRASRGSRRSLTQQPSFTTAPSEQGNQSATGLGEVVAGSPQNDADARAIEAARQHLERKRSRRQSRAQAKLELLEANGPIQVDSELAVQALGATSSSDDEESSEEDEEIELDENDFDDEEYNDDLREIFEGNPVEFANVVTHLTDSVARRVIEETGQRPEGRRKRKSRKPVASPLGTGTDVGKSEMAAQDPSIEMNAARQGSSDESDFDDDVLFDGEQLEDSSFQASPSADLQKYATYVPPRGDKKSQAERDARAAAKAALREQLRLQTLVSAIIDEVNALWPVMSERTPAQRAHFFKTSMDIAWTLQKKQALNLQRLVSILDRKAGRRGWIPYYDEQNQFVVAEDPAKIIARGRSVGAIQTQNTPGKLCLGSPSRKLIMAGGEMGVESSLMPSKPLGDANPSIRKMHSRSSLVPQLDLVGVTTLQTMSTIESEDTISNFMSSQPPPMPLHRPVPTPPTHPRQSSRSTARKSVSIYGAAPAESSQFDTVQEQADRIFFASIGATVVSEPGKQYHAQGSAMQKSAVQPPTVNQDSSPSRGLVVGDVSGSPSSKHLLFGALLREVEENPQSSEGRAAQRLRALRHQRLTYHLALRLGLIKD